MSFDGRWANGLTYRIDVEGKGLQGRIWTQLRNDDTPSVIVPAKTQDGVPSCVDVVYLVEMNTTEFHRLLSLDDASDVVNEEDQEAGSTLISVSLKIPRKISPTGPSPELRMRREGTQGPFP